MNDFEQLAAECQISLALTVGEDAVVANAMATRRQNMEEEAADEFVRLEDHGLLPTAMAVILPFERNGFIVAGKETAVGDGDAMGVTGEIAQHLFGPGEGSLGVNHPVDLTRRAEMVGKSFCIRKRRQIGEEFEIIGLVGGNEKLQEQAAEQTREHAYGQEEAGPAGNPVRSVRGKATTRHNAMEVGMVLQVLTPAMEHGNMTDAGAEMLRLGGDGAQGLGGGLEQNAIDHSLVLISDLGDGRRQGEDDMKVWHR